MVRLIMGAKGAGKTKQLIEKVHEAVKSESGSVVCIEPSADMRYDISHDARLVNASEYRLDSYECLRGFICGLYAGNYDISHVFVDNLMKIVGDEDLHQVEKLLDWLDRFSEKNAVKFTVTISGETDMATEGMRRYL
ncbi:MAG: ATP-binding protein [Oscillospiraceae bacterium]|nr:ATP-binding protein [Oscillospiraceae bacterium]